MLTKYFRSDTLESAWLLALRSLVSYGQLVKEKENFLELQNIQISYHNAFETDSSHYQQIFGREFLDYMRRVYSSGGDPETGRDYYSLIYKQGGINQEKEIIKKLQQDPLTRSAIIVLASPKDSKKPCVTEIAFSIRHQLLHVSVVFKSSDLAKKFVPDMIEISNIHKKIAYALNISRGSVTAIIMTAQLYETDLEIVRKKVIKLKNTGYFKTDTIIENWDKEAEEWDKHLKDPEHYVNFEDGYSRFLKFINSEIPKVNGKLALDSGCGTGIIAMALNEKGYRTVGVDISPKMLEFAHKNELSRNYVLANSLDIPYPDQSFDLVCSRGVLISHVGKKYVDLFLKEHNRVLKKGGLFMFDFITKFKKTELKKSRKKASMSYATVCQMLKAHGFEPIKRSGEDINRVNAILCKKI